MSIIQIAMRLKKLNVSVADEFRSAPVWADKDFL